MDSKTKSLSSGSTPKKPSPLPPTPLKSAPRRAADQIETPEKPVELPRRARNRGVALSVKEVRQVALGLQRTDRLSTNRTDSNRSNDDLASVARQLSGPPRKPPKARTPVKLLQKYEILGEFFASMVSSIQLLRLKGTMATFSNICTSIQHLTDRRFTYGHLAQLKYILPEAISIKKVLVHDEATCCMKPELQISLQVDTIGDGVMPKGESGYSGLRKVFRERLERFSEEHPQGDDIPEEELPHPFNHTKRSIPPRKPSDSTSPSGVESVSNTVPPQPFQVPSIMSRSFQRRFSQKILLSDAEKTPLTCLDKASCKQDPLVPTTSPPVKINSRQPISRTTLFSSQVLSRFSTQKEETKELSETVSVCPKVPNTLEGTPAKLVSTPARLMTATPDIQTPKAYRPAMAYDSPPAKKPEKRTARTKLFSTPRKRAKTEDEEIESKSSPAEDDVISFLPEALLRSVREKERKAMEDKEAGVAEANRRQKMITCLPDIFDVIHLIFQSGNRSVMTKQELIHKIIAGHSKTVDSGEVEEQLKLLQEIVPDWIYVKNTSTGENLYCVNKICSVEEIRQRLAEAE